MRYWLLLFCYFFFSCQFLLAQQFSKPVNHAFLITRMVEKFHFQPKPLDDEFSSHIFDQLIKQLDGNKLFFTTEDLKTLSKFQFELDDEIKNKQSSFLSAVTKIFMERISSADTMINAICKTPFNFSLPEAITALEMNSYPADETAMLNKLYKSMKAAALDEVLDDDKIVSFDAIEQKKYVDSIEPSIRRKVQKYFQSPIHNWLQGPGGIEQAMGEEYCKAIAVCYDPHTEFFPLTKKENFESALGQQTMAFGFQFKKLDDGTVKIENIAPGSAAFKSGQINKGDKIESVQWEEQQPINVSEGGLQQLTNVLGMSNHDKATFKIKKPDGSVRTVVLWKEKMEDEDESNKVKSFILEGNKKIGFISLPAFYQDWDNEETGVNGCANDVAKEILKLKKENIQGLILDLRYNGGGSMREAVELAGIFIDAGPVAQLKRRDTKVITLTDVNRGTMFDGPLTVLVNGYSASASEMVAGTLQDYNRALIVGSPTYGKATSQVVLPMDTTITFQTDINKIKTDTYLKVTVSQLYRVNGQTAQAKGVQPDIVLPDILDAHPQREASEPYVLISSPTEPNKYFKPGPAIETEHLKNFAKSKIDTSSFFIRLKKYIASDKADKMDKKINLKLTDAVEEKRKNLENLSSAGMIENEKPFYTVQNNLFEKQQLQGNERLREMNEQWVEFLTTDPWLHMAYDLMQVIIK